MKDNQFFAMMARMKYINRWGLMKNTLTENICEHSLDVAMIAHALGVINNKCTVFSKNGRKFLTNVTTGREECNINFSF